MIEIKWIDKQINEKWKWIYMYVYIISDDVIMGYRQEPSFPWKPSCLVSRDKSINPACVNITYVTDKSWLRHNMPIRLISSCL